MFRDYRFEAVTGRVIQSERCNETSVWGNDRYVDSTVRHRTNVWMVDDSEHEHHFGLNFSADLREGHIVTIVALYGTRLNGPYGVGVANHTLRTWQTEKSFEYYAKLPKVYRFSAIALVVSLIILGLNMHYSLAVVGVAIPIVLLIRAFWTQERLRWRAKKIARICSKTTVDGTQQSLPNQFIRTDNETKVHTPLH